MTGNRIEYKGVEIQQHVVNELLVYSANVGVEWAESPSIGDVLKWVDERVGVKRENA